MTKLTDTQAVLLSAAANRDGGAVLPAPASTKAEGAALDRTLKTLLKRGLASEQVVNALGQAWRETDDGQKSGLFITSSGLAAIGIEAEHPSIDKVDNKAPETNRPSGKPGEILVAVERKKGATLAELTDRTGWQPHTARAALTRLRQWGFPIALETRNKRKAYYLTPLAA